jgi:hypothetical protein
MGHSFGKMMEVLMAPEVRETQKLLEADAVAKERDMTFKEIKVCGHPPVLMPVDESYMCMFMYIKLGRALRMVFTRF